ncbi:helix-hairpin-helix DNA-binding protein, class 1 [Ruegeria lacuscaerulensis ITI-1157]|nr:helix-hairpin-helix DNA-binding protein, class 1 [Ruegeria lacuscaerulensis ITI-1157]SHJ08688.1 Helix-hairpin-helix domain-containing protein [Ruegeria lacuscaerulensis ITI-1157]
MTSVTNVRGVGKSLGQELSRRGIKTAQDLAGADPENLVAIPRIGSRRAQALILAANQTVAGGAAPAKPSARTAPKPEPKSGRAVSGKSKAPTRNAEAVAEKAASEKAAADAKARKKAKAKAKAEKAARKKKEMEAAIQKAKEKIKSKAKKNNKEKKDGKASKKDGKSKKSKKEKKKAKKK